MAEKTSKMNPVEVLIGGVIFATVIVIKWISAAYTAATGWSHYTFPAKYVAAWYYFGLVVPARGLVFWIYLPGKLIYGGRLTRYPNLNSIIAVVAALINIVLTVFAVIILVRLIVRKLGRAIIPVLLLILFGPIGFWGGWLLFH